MNRTRDLPQTLQNHLAGRDLVLFDGECVLCSGFFRFIIRTDKAQRFHFAHAQSSLGAELYAALGMPRDDFETNLVIVDGMIYERLDAFAAAMAAVGWPWKALAVIRFIPEPLRSFLYHRLAKNRYAIFGRYDVCMMPDPTLMARFIDREAEAS
ncbi:MAG: DUF393 domain-containing protein [Roseicyclus sp.]|nr:DUF393 domain-containing protein [Roseicyclus sp.]